MDQYYIDNLLSKLNEALARIAELERQMMEANAATPIRRITTMTPYSELPLAADIPPLYIPELSTGDLFQLVAVYAGGGGEARLQLWPVGRSRL